MAKPESFPIAEVHKLPYVRRIPDHGRVVPLKAYWDHNEREWHVYFAVSAQEFGRLAAEPHVGSYLGFAPANPRQDIEWPLGSFIIRHLSFPRVLPWLDRFEHRYYQLAVALDTYAAAADARNDRSKYRVVALLEYVIMTVRSLYDLLQRVIGTLAENVRVPTDPVKQLMSTLPDSFASLVLQGDTIRGTEAIVAKYNIPRPIAEFFNQEAARFKVLRDIRNSIEHHGNTPSDVYATASGFAVNVNVSPWNQLPIWKPELLRRERFGSLRSVFAYLAQDSFDTTTRFAEAFASCIAVPLSLGDDVRLYLRHPAGEWLVRLNELLNAPWELETGGAA